MLFDNHLFNDPNTISMKSVSYQDTVGLRNQVRSFKYLHINFHQCWIQYNHLVGWFGIFTTTFKHYFGYIAVTTPCIMSLSYQTDTLCNVKNLGHTPGFESLDHSAMLVIRKITWPLSHIGPRENAIKIIEVCKKI